MGNLRIGRQVEHSKRVDKSSLRASFSKCNKFRYLLKYDFIGEGRDKTISIIMKNPSSADALMADNTNRRVQDYVFTNFPDVKTVLILNIFAIRATDAKDVNIIKTEVDFVNDIHIMRATNQSDYIITAWGGASGINKKLYDARVKIVQGILKGAKCPIYRINPQKGSWNYPFHFCFASLTHEKELFQGA